MIKVRLLEVIARFVPASRKLDMLSHKNKSMRYYNRGILSLNECWAIAVLDS